MKYVSAIMTAAVGKVRGLVASHNKGGTYFRGKTIPVNPRSAGQIAQRARVSTLVERFRITLVASARAAWDTFSKNVSVIDSLGNSMSLSGPNWYLKSNTIRMQGGLAIVDNGPTTFSLSTLSPLTGTIVASAGTVQIGWSGVDEWQSNSNTAGVMIYASRPQNTTINYFSNPFQFVGRLASTASNGQSAFTLPFPAGPVGSKIFFRAVASAVDGRPSPELRFLASA